MSKRQMLHQHVSAQQTLSIIIFIYLLIIIIFWVVGGLKIKILIFAASL